MNRVTMSLERNLIQSRFGERVRALRALENATVERKVMMMDAMKRVRELVERGCSINGSNLSLKIVKFLREVQQLTGVVKSKDLKLQTMP